MTTRSKTLERALEHTRRFEGGYVNDPDDPGGATKYGISLRFLRELDEIERFDYDGDGDLDAEDVRALTTDDADRVYAAHFWNERFERLDPLVAIKLFDFGVNVGPRQRTRFAQRAANEIEPGRLIVDGILGPHTLEALREFGAHPTQAPRLCGDLEDHAARFYYDLAERRRASRKYLFGWLRRCYARPEFGR